MKTRIQRLIEFKTDSKHAHFMLTDSAKVVLRFATPGLQKIEKVSSSFSASFKYFLMKFSQQFRLYVYF